MPQEFFQEFIWVLVYFARISLDITTAAFTSEISPGITSTPFFITEVALIVEHIEIDEKCVLWINQ